MHAPAPSQNPTTTPRERTAVVLLSGGLDSATVLAMARSEGLACHALTFDYGQRHRTELEAAARIAESLGAASHRVMPLSMSSVWLPGASSLTGGAEVPKDRDEAEMAGEIPSTYVPARNLVFLSIAVGLCEVLGAQELYIGVNQLDYSGYPDCRGAFIDAFQRAANLATRAGVETPDGGAVRIRTPLIDLTKAQIIRRGTDLGVDYGATHSCYDPAERDGASLACGRCDSCALRRRGFEDAGLPDPTRYQAARA